MTTKTVVTAMQHIWNYCIFLWGATTCAIIFRKLFLCATFALQVVCLHIEVFIGRRRELSPHDLLLLESCR